MLVAGGLGRAGIWGLAFGVWGGLESAVRSPQSTVHSPQSKVIRRMPSPLFVTPDCGLWTLIGSAFRTLKSRVNGHSALILSVKARSSSGIPAAQPQLTRILPVRSPDRFAPQRQPSTERESYEKRSL